MKDDLSTFKDPVTPTSPLKKSPPKKRDSPQLLQKPKPSSSDSSPEPKRRGGSPRSSPHVSPVTSPKEHKKFGFFSKKAKKKPVRSNSVKEAGGRAGKAVLLPGKYNVSKLQMIVVCTSFTYYEFFKDKIYVHIQLCICVA
jgi:hypothetical protein